MASNDSYIPAEVSRNSWIDIEVEVEQSMLSYLTIWIKNLHQSQGSGSPQPARSQKSSQQVQQILSVAISTMGASEV